MFMLAALCRHKCIIFIIQNNFTIRLYRGCTNGTVTFFRYDVLQKQLITVHIIHLGKVYEQQLVSCLHLSQDKVNRHLAVATFSDRESVLHVLRFGDPPELDRGNQRRNIRSQDGLMVDLTEVLVDRYKSKRNGRSMWTIKVFIEYDYLHFFQQIH